MRKRSALVAVAAAVLGLAGSLAATAFLHASATRALDQVLDERLRGAGEAAAGLLQNTAPSATKATSPIPGRASRSAAESSTVDCNLLNKSVASESLL